MQVLHQEVINAHGLFYGRSMGAAVVFSLLLSWNN